MSRRSEKSVWPRALVALMVVLLAIVDCDKKRPPEPAPVPPAPAPAAKPEDTSFRFPAAERIVAFGDVHGDVDATRKVLRMVGAINDEDDWIGGKLVVVQTGDQLDRGDQEPQILDLFEKLIESAKKAGGAFHVLNGNHEVMNVAGDFRYVTPGGFRSFASTGMLGAQSPRIAQLPPDEQGRARAFFPGGPMALRLAEHPVAIVVGDSVFVHGGILPEHARYGLGRINQETRRWMRRQSALPAVMQSEHAPIWTREYSESEPSARACRDLSQALELLHARRMVVGHTPQKDGIVSGCDGKIWRIDVGLSRYYGGRPAALEIRGDHVAVIDSDKADGKSAK